MKVKDDPSCTSELFALACGPSCAAFSVDSCTVNGVKFIVHDHDLRRSTQNSGISTPNPSGGMYYGLLEEIIELEYIPFKVVLFKVKWFDTNNNGRIKRCTYRNNITQIMTDRVSFELQHKQHKSFTLISRVNVVMSRPSKILIIERFGTRISSW